MALVPRRSRRAAPSKGTLFGGDLAVAIHSAPMTTLKPTLEMSANAGIAARTEALFRDQFVPDFQGIARRAKRKLEAINAASGLSYLAVPPSNRLERLRGIYEASIRSG